MDFAEWLIAMSDVDGHMTFARLQLLEGGRWWAREREGWGGVFQFNYTPLNYVSLHFSICVAVWLISWLICAALAMTYTRKP